VTTVDPDPSEPSGRSAYRRRFLFLYGVLLLFVAAGVAGFIFLVNKPEAEAEAEPQPQAATAPAAAPSEWAPSGTGLDGAREIAAYVSSRYLLPSGEQLVEVRAGAPVIRDKTLSAIAIKPSDDSEDVTAYPASSMVVYILCGDVDQNCSITQGEASRERGQVLRREGLELALYTFKHLAEIDSVFEFMPPALGEEPKAALFFRREDLAQELEQPLSATLSAPPPYVSTGVEPSEADIIDRLTGARQFTYVFGELEDGTAGALLTPFGS